MTLITCPQCGNKTEVLIRGRCRECFFQNFAIAQLPRVIQARVCATCGARLSHGKWTDEYDMENIVLKTVEDNISIHKDANDVQVCINTKQITPYMYSAKVNVAAKVEEQTVTDELFCEVRLIRESCDMCSRISGGYFEGILQIRAVERTPTDREIEICLEIIEGIIHRMRAKGDRLAFITEKIRSKEGLDLYIGSVNFGRHVCKAITEELGGTYNESPSLFTQKDGREIYRITFSVRLPKFMPGAIINTGTKKIIVKHMGKKLTGIDLTDSSRFIAAENQIESAKQVGHIKDAVYAVLVAEDEQELIILDPVTFRTVNVKKPPEFLTPENEEIPVIRIEEELFLLPSECKKINTLKG